MPDDVSLRPASLGDAEILLQWRNDLVTISASHDARPVAAADHLTWLEASISNPARQLYVAEWKGIPVGTARADQSRAGWTLSWTVAPELRGKGFAKTFVALLAGMIDGPVLAEVKIGNDASAAIARHAGLRLVEERSGVLYFRRDGTG